MNHPLLKNIKFIFGYVAVWTLIAAIHAISTYAYVIDDISLAIADALVFEFLLAMFSLALWYVIQYSQPQKSSYFNIFFSHITSSVVLIALWISSSIGLLQFFAESNPAFISFLYKSIPWRIIDGIIFYLLFVLIYYLIIYYNNLQEKLNAEKRLTEMVKEAELNLLKSQINPHFLFNSLNSISSLTLTSPEKAQNKIVKLSDFLRYSIKQSGQDMSDLKTEIENILRYLEIEQVRFGSRLQFEYNISDSANSAVIPLMILQPIYENAVKHGVHESTEPVRIITNAFLIGNLLNIEIINNFDPDVKSRKGAGMGLKNISDRLKLIYGNELLLKTSIIDNNFCVKILIPQE